MRELGLTLSLKQPGRPGLHDKVIASDALVAPAPREHWPEAERRQPLSLTGLTGEALIGLSTADPLFAHLKDYLNAVEPPPQVKIAVQTCALTRALVEAGASLVLVNPFTAPGTDLHSTAIHPLSPALPVTLYAITHADETPPHILALLPRVLTRQAEERLRAVQMQHSPPDLSLETLDVVLAHVSHTYRSGFRSGQFASQPQMG